MEFRRAPALEGQERHVCSVVLDGLGVMPLQIPEHILVARMPTPPGQRIIVMGDPRDKNVLWYLQRHYAETIKDHGANMTLLPLERGRPPEFHSLVDLAETATGLCAEGAATSSIEEQLRAMQSQAPRESN